MYFYIQPKIAKKPKKKLYIIIDLYKYRQILDGSSSDCLVVKSPLNLPISVHMQHAKQLFKRHHLSPAQAPDLCNKEACLVNIKPHNIFTRSSHNFYKKSQTFRILKWQHKIPVFLKVSPIFYCSFQHFFWLFLPYMVCCLFEIIINANFY